MTMNQGDTGGAKLTGLGKMLSFLFVVGLIALGGWIVWSKTEGAKTHSKGSSAGAGAPGTAEGPVSEAPDTAGVTTVKEYKYVPADKLPPVKGVSQYEWNNNDKVLKFSYNVWSGWLPVIA